MTISIKKKIEELKLLDEAQQYEELTLADKARRLKLVKHPFVRKVRDLLIRYNWIHTERVRKETYRDLDQKSEETLKDLQKKMSYQLEAEGEQVTEQQLAKIFSELMKAEEFVV